MGTQSTEERSTEHLRTVPRRRFVIVTMLLSLDALVLGGCITLLIVNRLLNHQLDVYAATQSMAAASTILDFMDDLLLFYLIYGGALLLLVLATASVWTWMMTQSRLLRYGVILLCLIVLVVLGGMWLLRGARVPVVPPTTPTPTLALIAEATTTPIPVPSSTPSVAMIHDTDARTGIESIDHVIDVVLEGDVDRLRDVLAFTAVGCTHEDGLGGPPKCREEESEGTEVEVLPFLGPEGHFLRRDEAHEWSGIEIVGLYAVYRVSKDAYSTGYYPAGQVGIIFVGAREQQSVVLQVDNGRVVRIDYVFGDSPESKLEREAEEVILLPPAKPD